MKRSCGRRRLCQEATALKTAFRGILRIVFPELQLQASLVRVTFLRLDMDMDMVLTKFGLLKPLCIFSQVSSLWTVIRMV